MQNNNKNMKININNMESTFLNYSKSKINDSVFSPIQVEGIENFNQSSNFSPESNCDNGR